MDYLDCRKITVEGCSHDYETGSGGPFDPVTFTIENETRPPEFANTQVTYRLIQDPHPSDPDKWTQPYLEVWLDEPGSGSPFGRFPIPGRAVMAFQEIFDALNMGLKPNPNP